MVMKMKENETNIQKINVYIEVNDYKINNIGESYKEYISCIDNNDNKTEVTFNTKENILTRTNDDITISIDFNQKEIRYHLKKENKTIASNIEVKEIQKQEKDIKIIYKNENETFNLKIKYETI